MNRDKFEFIFIILVYRNIQDLKDFFYHFNIQNSKVIVVNSYFDSVSEKEFKEIAEKNKADFINVPNKGYGAGNNVGVKYAMTHYEFDWLIISNADIIISKFNRQVLEINKNSIIAPKILTKRGKNQNPSSPFPPCKFIEDLIFYTYRGDHNYLIWLFYALSRFNKIMYYTFHRLRPQIFAPHGAFIIIPHKILNNIVPIFNEEMFLFYEENHLGKLAKQKGIQIIYSSDIVIQHKEDGSISLINTSNFKLSRDSFIKYYQYWYKPE